MRPNCDAAQGIFFGALLLAFGIWRIRILTRRLRATLQKARPGFLGRLGERLWRRQLKSMDLQIARSDDLFANLDRWLWKQHQRETEAWLAQAADVHDLEARIRHLERNRDGRVF